MFRLPTQIHFKPGTLSRLPEAVARHGSRRVLLVTDAGLAATPWMNAAVNLLRRSSSGVTVADTIEPNPRYATIDAIADQARHDGVDGVVALGGGSVLDAGKAAAMLLKNPGSCLDYEGRNQFHDGSMPFVAVPTTCGTGSEVTWVSVISNPDQQRKLSIKGEAMFPDDALVDPDLLSTLPAPLIAYTGMDAYTHAIEAYTCNCGNPFSDALAEKAVTLLDAFLPSAFDNIENQEARTQVMRASTLAGMAFGNADVAGVHCLSESIGGLFDVPHGLANAILLAPVMRFHRSFIEDRLAQLYSLIRPRARNDASTEDKSYSMLEAIETLVGQLGIPPFRSLNIPVDAYDRIASASVTNNSNGSNPQSMTEKEYLRILNSPG